MMIVSVIGMLVCTVVIEELPGIDVRKFTVIFRIILWRVWFIPDSEKSLVKSIVVLPKIDSLIGIIGPHSFKNSSPVRLPIGIPISFGFKLDISSEISKETLDLRMLIF